jgi:porphobilinogen synthase
MPAVFRFSVDALVDEIALLCQQGLQAVILFTSLSPHLRTESASEALNPDGPVPRALRKLRNEFPDLCLIGDIALDPFSSHGHDGVLRDGDVDNDGTIALLTQMALLHAECGADFVAPSDMMDGRIVKIRQQLDLKGYDQTGILSYCVKYHSSLYSPFRDALRSPHLALDKSTYQMDPANRREAIREMELDEEEGADLLMVKPALLYLDIIHAMSLRSQLPICAFHVSGEYSMVMAAHERGFLDADRVFHEMLLSIKRAGADCIISYAVPRILQHIYRENLRHCLV